METSVSFNTSDLDDLSEVPNLHLSALIQILLPLRLVEWKSVKKHYEIATCDANRLLTDNLKENFKFLVTGSNAEGFAIPTVVVTEPEKMSIQTLSDVDLLFVHRIIPISTEKLPDNHTTPYRAYLDYDSIHPGYARICTPIIKQDDETFVFVDEVGKHYMSSAMYRRKLISNLSKYGKDETTETQIQGPAISLYKRTKLTLGNINTEDGIPSDTDIVCALPCFPWPQCANSIKHRAEMSDWLRPSLVDSIVSDGCHIVAVPSKSNKNPDLEWRLSFSASEGRLAREAVTDHQRQCYLVLKILCYQSMKPKSILSSYVFKSVFLYCCEQLPLNYWTDFPGNCLQYMLDVVLECLDKKHVPTFFLPENNLIDHLTENEIETAISTVEELKLDPITPIIDFMKDKKFACHCAKINFGTMVKPLLDDIKEYRQHRNKKRSIDVGIFTTYYVICVCLLKEQSDDKEEEMRKHQDAVRYMEDAYTNWIQKLRRYDSLIHFLNSVGLEIRNIELSVKFFEAVLSLSAQNPEYLSLRGNLACMYHSVAYKHAEGSISRNKFLNVAGEMFKQVYDDDRCSVIDYVTYLVKQKKFDEAMQALGDIPTDEGQVTNSDYVYNATECETLEDPLKAHVQKHGSISGDTVSFAYFYMVKCLCVLEKDPRRSSSITSVLNKFSKYCKAMEKENLFVLLHYANELAARIVISK